MSNGLPDFEFATFAFQDVGAVTLPGVKRIGDAMQLPVLGAFTVAVTLAHTKLTPTEDRYMRVLHNEIDHKTVDVVLPRYLQTWNVGISFCSPQDIPRFNRNDGNLLAVSRALDAPFLVGSVAVDDLDLGIFPFRIFEDPEFVAGLPVLPSWVRKALKLQGYFKLIANRHNHHMVTSPLVRLLFGQQTPRKEPVQYDMIVVDDPKLSPGFMPTTLVERLSYLPPERSGRMSVLGS